LPVLQLATTSIGLSHKSFYPGSGNDRLLHLGVATFHPFR
jgi:hypothetical protein